MSQLPVESTQSWQTGSLSNPARLLGLSSVISADCLRLSSISEFFKFSKCRSSLIFELIATSDQMSAGCQLRLSLQDCYE